MRTIFKCPNWEEIQNKSAKNLSLEHALETAMSIGRSAERGKLLKDFSLANDNEEQSITNNFGWPEYILLVEYYLIIEKERLFELTFQVYLVSRNSCLDRKFEDWFAKARIGTYTAPTC